MPAHVGGRKKNGETTTMAGSVLIKWHRPICKYRLNIAHEQVSDRRNVNFYVRISIVYMTSAAGRGGGCRQV